jgi:lipoate-protein ligase A
MTDARWVDLGLVAPPVLHGAYAGLALTIAADPRPAVLWGRATGHLCVGQAQDPARVANAAAGVPVLRRPLGGGAVWVDEGQWCFAIVCPLALAPPCPADWSGRALAPMARTCAAFGLHAVPVDTDLWLGRRKIAGTGAATIGRCAVVASSFLLHFDAGRFARAMACPGVRARAWLEAGVRLAVTDWASNGIAPDAGELARVFRSAVGAAFGWTLHAAPLADHAAAAGAAYLDDLAADDAPVAATGREWRIKLNARSHLAESGAGRRRLVIDGRRAAVLRG